MKSLLMVERTEVLQRNIPEDWSVKDQISCKERQNGASGGGKVHKCMRTHGSEGATEPGMDGPGPVGPSRPAWPSHRVGSAPLSLHPKDLQP
jgi:hypothetical protein